jgi:pyridoxine/pyridoxamine 5'-phosphate oxidase
MTRKELYDFMAQQKLAVVGSTSAEGSPQSALVGIAVTDALEIIFDTLGTSRKYGNLTHDPRASIVLGWSGEITVQLEGEAFRPEGVELSRYKSVYFAKWEECRSHESWPEIAYFVIRPTWIRYSDFDQRPPLIEEFSF